MDKATKADDLRVIKTRKAIRAAFVSLLLEKGFAAITIQDIADRALVNRKTFYRHYADKYELAAQIVDEALDAAAGPILSAVITSEDSAVGYCEQLYAHRELILAAWTIHLDGLDFVERLKDQLREKYLAQAVRRGAPGDLAFQASLFSAFVVETLRYILSSRSAAEAALDPTFATGEFANLLHMLQGLNTWAPEA